MANNSNFLALREQLLRYKDDFKDLYQASPAKAKHVLGRMSNKGLATLIRFLREISAGNISIKRQTLEVLVSKRKHKILKELERKSFSSDLLK